MRVENHSLNQVLGDQQLSNCFVENSGGLLRNRQEQPTTWLLLLEYGSIEQKLTESHFAHDRGTRFDLGELAVELGLVLCSIAVLMKKAAFWFSGMAAAAVGAVIAATVLFMSPHAEGHGHEHSGAATEQHASDTGHGH